MCVDVWARAVASRRSGSTCPCASCSWRTSPDSTSPTCMIAFGPAHCASTTRITPVAVRIDPVVADLPAALGVERRHVQEDADVLTLLGHRQLAALGVEHRHDLPVGVEMLVPDELGRRHRAGLDADRHAASPRPRGARALLLQELGEAVDVHLQPRLGRQLLRQLQREPERVGELERLVAGQDLAFGVLLDRLLEQLQPLAERRREPILLRRRHLQHERLVLAELRVRVAHQLDRAADQRLQHRSVDAEPAGVRDHAAEHPSQDVAAPLVRRLDAVGDQEARGASRAPR